jgi:hypothetical protein
MWSGCAHNARAHSTVTDQPVRRIIRIVAREGCSTVEAAVSAAGGSHGVLTGFLAVGQIGEERRTLSHIMGFSHNTWKKRNSINITLTNRRYRS